MKGLSSYQYGVDKMQMEKKQFVVIFFTIIAFLFLGYEVFRLVSDDIDIKFETKNDPVNQMHSSVMRKVDPDPNPTPAPIQTSAPTHPLIEKKATLFAGSSQKTENYKKTYMELINLYELAKMKRQLLEEEAAIAEAQQRIAEINKSTERINHAGIPLVSASSNQSNTSSYLLSYIDKQNGQWSAVLKKDGVYQTVTAGSLLPDHYQVISINEKGVILKNKNQQVMVTFNGTMALSDSKVEASKDVKKALALKPPKKIIHYSWHAQPLLNLPLSAN